MNRNRTLGTRLACAAGLCLLAWNACAAPRKSVGEVVLAWNQLATEATVAFAQATPPGLPPYREARIYAMAFVAMHDTLNAIELKYEPYACRGRSPNASPTAAVATAAYHVLSTLFPPGADRFGTAYRIAMAEEPDAIPGRKQAGITLGHRCAEAILRLRADDGADLAQVPYVPSTEPGDYRFTFPFDQPGPAYGFVADPLWGDVLPFVLENGDQFRSPPPYAVTDAAYAADVDEIRLRGAHTGSNRTDDETEIAVFWEENSPLGWNRIARTVAVAQNVGGWELARLFALLQLAEADAYIASFETKFHYEFWRPITAIRLADTDGNPATTADPTWLPLDPVTPPVPDYNSAHAAAGGAARAVLYRFFGRDDLPFAQTSVSLPGVTRNYASFTQAADENGLSRILVGFHFRLAVTAGRTQGEQVGTWVFDHALRPLD
jgi:hypothetical protein